ncbi:MAG: amidase [Acidimicrobiaceae bacterium]|nr:amidase [Acidimicrobiaceae bacterium]
MDVPDFRTVTVEALAAMVRDRTLAAAAVTEHSLERIEALNPVLNAFVAVDADSARAEAAAIDERLDAGDEVGPLAGIPVGVKDLVDATGFHTSKGAMYTRHDPPAASDCTEVARMRAAGCVIVGKTNTPEHGCMGDTYNPRFGPTLNPWNPDRSPGGSSGGTGSAVASGMVPAGTGSDGGGSIRIPSALCGLSGIKTSQGRVPSGPPPSGLIDLSCVGPMARLIRDVALCLDAMVGPDPADLRSLPKPDVSWRAALDSPRVPARVLWAPSIDGAPVDAEIAAACAAAVERLAAEGVEVVEVGAAITAVPGAFLQLFFGGLIGPAFRPLYGTDEWENVTEVLAVMLEDVYQRATPESIYRARQQAGELSMALAELMEGYDALLMPTLAGQAPPPGGHGTIDGEETPNWFRFTPLANLTRRPAGTVCCGFSSEGVPIGLQVVGHQLDDLTVLETLAILEDLLTLNPIAPGLAP